MLYYNLCIWFSLLGICILWTLANYYKGGWFKVAAYANLCQIVQSIGVPAVVLCGGRTDRRAGRYLLVCLCVALNGAVPGSLCCYWMHSMSVSQVSYCSSLLGTPTLRQHHLAVGLQAMLQRCPSSVEVFHADMCLHNLGLSSIQGYRTF